jgi:hypothetical protein
MLLPKESLLHLITVELMLCGGMFCKQDFDGQRRAEKLSRIIITLFGVSIPVLIFIIASIYKEKDHFQEV